MNLKLLLKKAFLYVFLPFFIISAAMLVFGKDPVYTFLKYSTPIMLLPLLIKLLMKIKDRKKSNMKP